MNTSMISAGSVPIGFRSFAEDHKPAALDQSMVVDQQQQAQEISFAESENHRGEDQHNESKLLSEI